MQNQNKHKIPTLLFTAKNYVCTKNWKINDAHVLFLKLKA